MNAGCPLCGEKSYSIIYTHLNDQAAMVVRCDHCQHIYSSIPAKVEFEKLYEDEVYKVVENRSSFFDKLLNWEYARVIKRINKYKPSKGSLLDFGSGKGKLGFLAKNDGWQVKCVETSIERAEYAQKIYGLDVTTKVYSNGKIFSEDFDVLSLFHVLEHLPAPQNLLNELIKHNVKKDGLVVIEVPNINSWQAKLAGSKWMHLDVPRHISHFTPQKLDQLAKEVNLVGLSTSFFSSHLGVLGMVDSFLKLFGYRKNIIYELKNKKPAGLIISIALLLPVSFIFEVVASWTGHGGIVRKYLIRIEKHKYQDYFKD